MTLQKAVPHIIAVVVFTILSCAFFFPQLEGNKILQHDITSFRGMAHELEQYQEETGERALWTNSMFGGMPAYQIRTGKGPNMLHYLEKLPQLFISRPIGYFLGGMVGMYLLMVLLGVSPWISMVGAIGFALATNGIVLFDAGHTSKLRSLFSAAPVIAGVILTYRGKWLLGGSLFSIALGVNLYGNHYQITYYVLLLLGIYAIFELVAAIREKKVKQFAIASAILAGGALLAIASSYSKISTTMEYAKDTMRGKPILESNNANSASSSETDGLAWDYAMNWSNGLVDLFSIVVPRAAGASASEDVGTESNLYQDFTSRGVRLGGELQAPLYFGELPSTAGPPYLGAIMIFLAILGLLVVEGRMKWWLFTAILLSILVSMGRHFEAFNHLLFDYVPYFNKFRAPSSTLTITSLFIPILATLGIAKLLKETSDRSKMQRGLIIATGVSAVICLVLGFAGGSIFNLDGANDSAYANMGFSLDALKEDRVKYLRADALRSLMFILATAGVLYAAMLRKLKVLPAMAIVALLVLVDLWGVGKRYINSDSFISESQFERVFNPRPVDTEILKDQDLHYRVHDVTQDPWNSAQASYHHHTIGGYHAAKLQRYQDIMDYYLYNGDQKVLNMLNAKYFIIADQNGGERVQRNPAAMGNAWFVEGIEMVESANEEIENLGEIDPRAMALIHEEFADDVRGFDPSRNGSIRLTSYAPDRLTYQSSSKSDQLAVFSEVWYGPDKGWEAYIDGQPAKILRANYLLRALNVPEGDHEIEMVFRPKKFYFGETVSLIVSLLMIVGFAGVLYLQWKNAPAEAPVTTTTTKTRKTRKGKQPKK